MKERGILFSAPMVRALLAGTKTQTRRILNPQPVHAQVYDYKGERLYDAEHRLWWWKQHSFENLVDFPDGKDRRRLAALSPYGAAGDRLWVRETWAQQEGVRVVAYRADGECGAWFEDGGGGRIWWRHGGIIGPEWRRPESWRGGSFGLHKFGGKWRPSIFMPRWASRITLEVTGVRVERLQDISDSDARAEGLGVSDAPGVWIPPDGKRMTYAQGVFRSLWEDINGAESWDANPFVWVVEFRRVKAQERAA